MFDIENFSKFKVLCQTLSIENMPENSSPDFSKETIKGNTLFFTQATMNFIFCAKLFYIIFIKMIMTITAQLYIL